MTTIQSEPEFFNLLRSPVIDSQPCGGSEFLHLFQTESILQLLLCLAHGIGILKNQCCGSGSGIRAFLTLTPGSRIGFFQIPDPRSKTYIFESLLTDFWVKSSKILSKLAQIFFFTSSKKIK